MQYHESNHGILKNIENCVRRFVAFETRASLDFWKAILSQGCGRLRGLESTVSLDGPNKAQNF